MHTRPLQVKPRSETQEMLSVSPEFVGHHRRIEKARTLCFVNRTRQSLLLPPLRSSK
ncbi:hypothetical protein M419DRAFT_124322 [Trichoderma reesei RUT C-30]|uniref:Uncharacterized protein n=1 Tax=Hypocrea jecorina (strain ATCC 56765 / BCRC 32924 / NRRL 11460 / Rut C-30) TaxID=1344414 RepID=A0A024S3A0_HYPJR|nr:hypothetical protein M419DRAFT_124322 [Trichoderma reesei RUT C-30]